MQFVGVSSGRRSGSRSTATPSPGCAPGPSGGRSVGGAVEGAAGLGRGRRAGPGRCRRTRRGRACPAGRASPAVEHRACPQDRPHRRCRGGWSRPAPPAAAPGARRGGQPRAAARVAAWGAPVTAAAQRQAAVPGIGGRHRRRGHRRGHERHPVHGVGAVLAAKIIGPAARSNGSRPDTTTSATAAPRPSRQLGGSPPEGRAPPRPQRHRTA